MCGGSQCQCLEVGYIFRVSNLSVCLKFARIKTGLPCAKIGSAWPVAFRKVAKESEINFYTLAELFFAKVTVFNFAYHNMQLHKSVD